MDFYRACSQGDLRKVRWLFLSQNRKVYSHAMWLAYVNRHTHIVNFLLDNGVFSDLAALKAISRGDNSTFNWSETIERSETKGKCIISNAYRHGRLDLVIELLESGCNSSVLFEQSNYHARILGKLINYGLSRSIMKRIVNEYCDKLQYFDFCNEKCVLDFFDLMKDCGVRIPPLIEKPYGTFSIIEGAINKEFLHVVDHLIKEGAKINKRDIFICCYEGKLNMLKLLHRHGVTITNEFIMNSIRHRHIINFFKEIGVQFPNNMVFKTMLCESGSPSVIDMFLGLGWVFNDNEIYCRKAIEYQNADNLEFLLKNHAPLNIRSFKDFLNWQEWLITRMEVNYQLDKNCEKLIQIMWKHDIIRDDDDKKLAFIFATGVENRNLVKYLVENLKLTMHNDFKSPVTDLFCRHIEDNTENHSILRYLYGKFPSIIEWLPNNAHMILGLPVMIKAPVGFMKDLDICPISLEKITVESKILICGQCGTPFIETAIKEWLEMGKQCPYKCGNKSEWFIR